MKKDLISYEYAEQGIGVTMEYNVDQDRLSNKILTILLYGKVS